jgi:hypothetical protein
MAIVKKTFVDPERPLVKKGKSREKASRRQSDGPQVASDHRHHHVEHCKERKKLRF